MADGKINPYDVGALERAVNDSATRVSGLWLSFVAFSAYLAAAASMISHRQIFLEEPIKLPTINIDLPLAASAILLPLLFVIYHVFVLVQVVLLARTADAYNQALECSMVENEGQTLVRQRLANTLFAQLFAGSSREREGVLGWLLRLMAWITLAIAPVFVLIVFEIKFLPYHSALVTWTHRGLIAIDLLMILLLWAGAVEPRREISWSGLLTSWRASVACTVIIAVCCLLLTFPGEPNRSWMQMLPTSYATIAKVPQCQLPTIFEDIFAANFDRLFLPGEDFVDGDKLAKIVASADKARPPYESERTRKLRGRDLSCGNFSGADLRRVDLTEAHLPSARLEGAKLEGARLTGATLERASMYGADLSGSDLSRASLENASSNSVQLQGARLDHAKLAGASLGGAQLQGADLTRADLQRAQLNYAVLEKAQLQSADLRYANLSSARAAGALLSGANLAGASLSAARLQGAKLGGANLIGATLHATQLQGADLSNSKLQGADLYGVNLSGADFDRAWLQAAIIRSAVLTGATFDRALLQGVQIQAPLQYVVISGSFVWLAQHHGCRNAWVTNPRLEEAIEVSYARTLEQLVDATPEGIESFINTTLDSLPVGSEMRVKMQTVLRQRFSADARKRFASMGDKWKECARQTEKPLADEDQIKIALDLIALACKADGGAPFVAEAIYANWVRTDRLNEASRKLIAERVLGRKESPCEGANGLSEDIKKALHEIIEPKAADN